MGQLDQIKGRQSSYTVYGTANTLDTAGRDIAPYLPDVASVNVLIIRPSDIVDPKTLDALPEQDREKAFADAYKNYLEANGITSEGTTDEKIWADYGVSLNQSYKKGGQEIRIIKMPENPDLADQSAGLKKFAQNDSLEFNQTPLDLKTLRAFALIHEAGHHKLEHDAQGLESESEADHVAFDTLEQMQKDGVLSAEPHTLQRI